MRLGILKHKVQASGVGRLQLPAVRILRNGWTVACLAVLVGAVLAVSTAQAQESTSQSTYRLGPQDELSIEVFEMEDFDVTQRVSENGILTLPLLGELDVRGMTTEDLRRQLTTLLEERFLNKASVTVRITDFRSQPISVIGAVRQPGDLPVRGRIRLLEAITDAGGLEENHGDRVYIIRRASNGLTDQVAISLDDLMFRGTPTANIPIFPNDLINVPAAEQHTIFFLGAVNSPGAKTFRSTDRMTILTALALANGLTDRAGRTAVIKRRDRNGEEIEIEINLRRILKGDEPDVELTDGDLVLVKEAFF